MNIYLPLSPEDQATADKLSMDKDRYAQMSILDKFNDRIENWDKIVSEIKDGYQFGIEDYANDIDTRHILGEIISELSPEGQARALAMLEPIDERFRQVTRPFDKSIHGEVQVSEWWYFRIPNVMGEELSDDLNIT